MSSDFGDSPPFNVFHTGFFWKIGCQGDRMPMHRASAPFLQGDKGDRRVTGVGAHSAQRGDNMCF